MEFFRPSPAIMALISLQTFFYLPILIVLSACRTGAATGAARALGGLTLAIALIGAAAHFGPPLLNLYTGPLPQIASTLTKAGGGMALPLVASLPLLASGLAPGRAWRWLDWAHGLALCALLGLWGWTRLV
ncbi:MAG: hypothetical protein EP318_01355 [Rhodobacteraceae bacterium]|nr:MAG: hypothetical protein EP318_01355 [Paracoccaceae bacterium]